MDQSTPRNSKNEELLTKVRLTLEDDVHHVRDAISRLQL
jgi:hypothetical protein